MKPTISIESISDGKTYDINDMVKADANGCQGCSACCHGVGDFVVLSPFDVFEICHHLNKPFEALLTDKLVLHTDGKITMPHLKMIGDTERCAFLDEKDRCEIHTHRPDICRLFPLGRFYEQDDFKYFLQVGACTKPKLEKVKVKKWLGISNYEENKRFILSWNLLVRALTFRLKFIRDDQELAALNAYFLETFYHMPNRHLAGEAAPDLSAGIATKPVSDFYQDFYERLPEAKSRLGII